ncbi:restriction endonuclease subunit S [Brevundimonas diminuta]|uniref:restriction endonuclease subunit S n=1 Tax=Brevundimonas diminuta TaxID=293 RepID=UPI0030FA87B7
MVRMSRFHALPLVELAEISAGHPLRAGVDELALGDIGVVQMRNADPDNGVDWSTVARVTLPPARRVDVLGEGDVIFSTRGSRTYAVALGEVPFQAVCSPHFFVLRVRRPDLQPGFLAWQINQAPAQEYLQREATGSHILNIRREVVERLEIVIPPLPEQLAIVAFAEAAARERRLLSDLIQNRQQQMHALASRLRATNEV